MKKLLQFIIALSFATNSNAQKRLTQAITKIPRTIFKHDIAFYLNADGCTLYRLYFSALNTYNFNKETVKLLPNPTTSRINFGIYTVQIKDRNFVNTSKFIKQ